jgi:hypothetical protein
MAEMPKTAAQQAAHAHAFQAARSYFDHRKGLQSLLAARPGMCMADGLNVHQQVIDGDFDLDEPLLQRLLQGGPTGPVMHAATSLRPAPAAAPAVSSALAGMGERDLARALREGIEAIRSGQVQRVQMSPMMELYNTAGAGRRPVVRLRLLGLPITVVQQSIAASGGPQNQWRPNPSQNAQTLPTRSMTAQQMRNAAVLAADPGQPPGLRWTQGRVGTGVLTLAPSAALALYNATEADLRTREFSFKGGQFLAHSARSRSGHVNGFAGSALAVTEAVGVGVAVAPLVVIELLVGVAVQVVWNPSGADGAANRGQRALN